MRMSDSQAKRPSILNSVHVSLSPAYPTGPNAAGKRTSIRNVRDSENLSVFSGGATSRGSPKHLTQRSRMTGAAEALRLAANSGHYKAAVSFGTMVDSYVLEALLERFSTRVSYQSMLKMHLKPRWSNHSLGDMAENPF